MLLNLGNRTRTGVSNMASNIIVLCISNFRFSNSKQNAEHSDLNGSRHDIHGQWNTDQLKSRHNFKQFGFELMRRSSSHCWPPPPPPWAAPVHASSDFLSVSNPAISVCSSTAFKQGLTFIKRGNFYPYISCSVLSPSLYVIKLCEKSPCLGVR